MAADGSDVDIDAVASCGKTTLTQVGDFSKGASAPVSKIGGAQAGMVGTNEAQTFNAWHGSMVEAFGKFLADTTVGIEALGFAAITIAANYRNGDISQANAMTEVISAFNPKKGTDSARSDLAAHEKKAAADGKKPADTGDGKSQLPPGHGQDPSQICTADPQSPSEQVRLHQDKYGENETWKPPDPNAPVDDYSSVPLGPGMI